MGRKPKPVKDRKSPTFLFEVSGSPEDLGEMEKFFIIAKRENVTLNELYLRSIKEYNRKHFKGNYQTVLAPSKVSELNRASVERVVRQKCLEYSVRHNNEITYRTIISIVCGHVADGKPAVAKRVQQWLKEQGVKVWR